MSECLGKQTNVWPSGEVETGIWVRKQLHKQKDKERQMEEWEVYLPYRAAWFFK